MNEYVGPLRRVCGSEEKRSKGMRTGPPITVTSELLEYYRLYTGINSQASCAVGNFMDLTRTSAITMSKLSA